MHVDFTILIIRYTVCLYICIHVSSDNVNKFRAGGAGTEPRAILARELTPLVRVRGHRELYRGGTILRYM